jgi:hypothetical protein
MLSSERLAEIRALTWEWKYEDCSDHQSAVDDLLAERDQLAAEGRVLVHTLEHCAKHAGCPSPCRDCPAEERGPVGGCKVQDDDWDDTPLTAAEVARVKRLEAVAEELTVMHDEYGKADDETLTPDAITLKSAINRVWNELERMCPDALAALQSEPSDD